MDPKEEREIGVNVAILGQRVFQIISLVNVQRNPALAI